MSYKNNGSFQTIWSIIHKWSFSPNQLQEFLCRYARHFQVLSEAADQTAWKGARQVRVLLISENSQQVEDVFPMRIFFDKRNVLVNDSRKDRVKKLRLFLVFSFLDDNLTDHLFFGFNVWKIVDEVKEALDVSIVILRPLIQGAILTGASTIVLDLHDFGSYKRLNICQVVNG